MSKWIMPKWMEPYRRVINNTGGNSVEDLHNDTTTTVFTNAPRALLCCCVHAQVKLLEDLHDNGLLGRREKNKGMTIVITQKRAPKIKSNVKQHQWTKHKKL